MFANIVYLILGFIIGFLIAIICGAGGRAGLEAEIAALEHKNRELEGNQKPAEKRETGYGQDKEDDNT